MTIQYKIRAAVRADLGAIIAMLADDPLGQSREAYREPLPDTYYRAYETLSSDPHNELVVASCDGEIAGVLQLTLIPGLTYQGSWRAQVEGVRVAAGFRSRGIGRSMFEWAIARAREKGCRLVQLTTDRQRPAALEFYRSLGFIDSHVGMKLHLHRQDS